MSAAGHDCGYVFPKFLEVSTVPSHALDPLEQMILHVECPKCRAHVDLTVILRATSAGKVLDS